MAVQSYFPMCVLLSVPTNCINEKKAEEKRRICSALEIDFLLPVIGMKLKMCVREIPNLASYTLMNDESYSTLWMIQIKKWRPLRFAHR